MARKKESRTPPAQRAAMSGFSKPGTAARGEWLIDWVGPSSVPAVDLNARKARLWSPAALYIEAHEGWHVAHTPHRPANEWARELAERTGTDVTVDDLRAVEDGRINRIGLDELERLSPGLHRRVYDGLGTMADPVLIKKAVTQLLAMGNQREAARMLVAGLPHTQPLLSYRAWRGEEKRDFIRELRRAVRAPATDIGVVARTCAHIAGLPSRPTTPPPPPPPPRSEPGDDTRAPVTLAPPPAHLPASRVQWGQMSIVEPKLTESVYDGSGALTRPSSEPGTAVKYPHRWRPWEGSFDVFGRKRRDQGKRARMSLLIDGSGSMSWSDDELTEVQERLPAATVAIYGSDTHDNAKGILCIIAEGGRRTVFDRYALTHNHHLGAGNVVDGPALRWLGRQAGPRVWLSDGRVTGVGDSATDELRKNARAICEACGITRVERGEALFAWLDAHGFAKSAVRRLR